MYLRTASRTVRQAGMTLIEIMVVITLIASLTAILAVNILGSSEEAKVQQTGIVMSQIKGALISFKQEYGRYPSTGEGLSALINPPPKKSGRARAGGFLDNPESLKDAWGNDLQYYAPAREGGKDYEIVSLGQDGSPGGEKAKADFTNWTL
jgi:general secretion pathway protein G